MEQHAGSDHQPAGRCRQHRQPLQQNHRHQAKTARNGAEPGYCGIESLLSSKNLAKNGASTFTFNGGNELRTFLALNDATAGFKANSDSVIEITGYSGSLSSLSTF